jgi:spore maturation protein CgeB
MRAAYIGILTPGSTSRMRAEWLRRVTPEWGWEWFDTDRPLTGSSRVWQSLAYRHHIGIAVTRINAALHDWLAGKSFDLVWIDKAVFLTPGTMTEIRGATRRLAHFTPDTAFYANKSRHFEKTLKLYDLLVTTKSFDESEYRRRLTRDSLLLTTQGFDPELHTPRISDSARKKGAVFVGLAELDRENCVTALIENGIDVAVGGKGWKRFADRWRGHPHFSFVGEYIFGDEYASILSQSWVGLGLLSKKFPELHTTRTFEIPACGTILATERNAETTACFTDSEALFFDDYHDLALKMKRLFDGDVAPLSELAHHGRHRVITDRRDYPGILSTILSDQRLS